ncbi:MAG TPA: GntR family transcriptional regulator [Pyrinomonadaceae bacterium]|nr:GntR family transcriptional regulator [Pyrinomonadaceae bacterium]
MRLWLSKNSDVPLREQLTTQIMLGIVSADLKPGQRLPSTRELARRFRVHSNTVSAAYRELERRGWLESRKGSGVYVRPLSASDERTDGLSTAAASSALPARDPRVELDRLISAFLLLARAEGFSLGEVQTRIKHWLELQTPDHFLVVEPEHGLREILVAEISEATGFPVRGASPQECADPSMLTGAAIVVLHAKAERVRALLPPATNCLLLHTRSVPESLKGEQPPPPDALVSVVSGWPDFLHWSRVVLVAAGLDPTALSFRDTREDGWERGLRSSAFVITDALTAKRLPPGTRARVFRFVADASLEELRRFVGQFLNALPSSAN